MQLFSIFKAYGKSNWFFNIFAALCVIFVTSAHASTQNTKKLVAIGDSLTAGYGLPQAEAFTTQLEAALKKAGHDIRIENAGVSGDTSTGGLQRLDWALGGGADFVFLELGANDALRGIEPSLTRSNLEAIIAKIKAKNIPIFFAGMKAPPNMGKAYQDEFDSIFPDLAEKHELAFYPFFLDGVASVEELNQEDAIHPNKEGVALIVEKMLPSMSEFLTKHQ